MISKMYTTKYIFKDLDVNDIVELVGLAHEIYIKNIDLIVSELVELFKENIDEDNWSVLLSSIFGNLSLKSLEKVLFDYFYYEVQAKNTLIFPDVDIDNEEIVKVLYDLYDKNNRKPIYEPYVKPNYGFPKLMEVIGISKYNLDTRQDIENLNMDLFKYTMSFPDIDKCSPKCKCEIYRKFYMVCLVLGKILEEYLEEIFDKLKELVP
ncbi:putative orfan [Tupanvirus soda lake]|uniref:Orfan n=2 Tax=Tupanvirus TaxID=2094720 RepID=A0AC62AAJ2_9VIRU|nr:putative orfan [Tupanvirus soda lake]QKU34790.1 putative orfan [Tupanvirus soda lake]